MAKFFQKHLILIILVIFAIGNFFIVKHYTPGTPSNLMDGYHGWFDQQQYYLIAKDLYFGKINAEQYLYPLGFPLIAVPFFAVDKIDPFLIPSLIIWVTSVILFYRTVLNYTNDKFVTILGTFIYILGTSISQNFVLYWTTNLGIFFSVCLMYIISLNKISIKYSLIIGCILGYYFFTRTFDFVFYFPLIILYVFELLKKRDLRKVTVHFFYISIFLTFFIILQGILDYYVFGNVFITPYSKHLASKMDWFVPELFISNWKGMLFGTSSLDENRLYPPLIRNNIISIILFLFSTLILVKSKFKSLLTLPYMVILIYIFFYGSYLFFSADNVKFYSERFLTPIIPIIIVIGMIQISQIKNKKF